MSENKDILDALRAPGTLRAPGNISPRIRSIMERAISEIEKLRVAMKATEADRDNLRACLKEIKWCETFLGAPCIVAVQIFCETSRVAPETAAILDAWSWKAVG